MFHTQGGTKMTVFGIYALTLPNIDRFSQLFHCQNQEKICNNPITKDLSHHTSSVSLHYLVKCQCLKSNNNTRMVQLPATAAIEYVAAGHFFPGGRSFGRGIFGRGCFCPGGLLPGWTFVRGLMPVPTKFNAYTHRLGFLCLAS